MTSPPLTHIYPFILHDPIMASDLSHRRCCAFTSQEGEWDGSAMCVSCYKI